MKFRLKALSLLLATLLILSFAGCNITTDTEKVFVRRETTQETTRITETTTTNDTSTTKTTSEKPETKEDEVKIKVNHVYPETKKTVILDHNTKVQKPTENKTTQCTELPVGTNSSQTTATDKQLTTKPTTIAEPTKATQKLSSEEVAKKVLRGEYGHGDDRRKNLEAEGYNYEEIQRTVNDLVATSEPETTQAPTNKPSTTQATTTAKVVPSQPAGTMVINGRTYYVGSFFGYYWDINALQSYIDKGYISTGRHPFIATDGKGTYIAGHAPGVLGPLRWSVGKGTNISVVDNNGYHRNYTVTSVVYTGVIESYDQGGIGYLFTMLDSEESLVIQHCQDGGYVFIVAK